MTAQTKHPSRARVSRMIERFAAGNGVTLDEAEAKIQAVLGHPDVIRFGTGPYLAALCDSWLGRAQPRAERSDRGRFHQLPEPAWETTCVCCGKIFTSSRSDASYCSPACRQRAYRERQATP
jgi:hypothetical protein